MFRITARAATAIGLLLSTAVTATADPVVPQPDTPCPPEAVGAMTWPMDAKMPMACVGQAGDGRWQTVTTPQPPSDRWISFGPQIEVYGEGRQNPNVRSGSWTATPLTPTTQCRAEQTAVLGPGVVGPPQVAEGTVGQRLEFDIEPKTFDLRLSGECLWARV